ncbi:hypothetical protein DFH05DRAFT_1553200, partial [Lentinula detonsa]
MQCHRTSPRWSLLPRTAVVTLEDEVCINSRFRVRSGLLNQTSFLKVRHIWPQRLNFAKFMFLWGSDP